MLSFKFKIIFHYYYYFCCLYNSFRESAIRNMLVAFSLYSAFVAVESTHDWIWMVPGAILQRDNRFVIIILCSLLREFICHCCCPLGCRGWLVALGYGMVAVRGGMFLLMFAQIKTKRNGISDEDADEDEERQQTNENKTKLIPLWPGLWCWCWPGQAILFNYVYVKKLQFMDSRICNVCLLILLLWPRVLIHLSGLCSNIGQAAHCIGMRDTQCNEQVSYHNIRSDKNRATSLGAATENIQ